MEKLILLKGKLNMKSRYNFFYPIILLMFLMPFGSIIISSVNKSFDQLTFNLTQIWNLISFVITIYFFLKIYNIKLKKILSLKLNWSIVINIFLCFITGILLHTFNNWVYLFFPQLTNIINLKYYEKIILYTDNLPYLLYVGILIPIFEEIIYRNFFFKRCSYELGYKKAIIIGALVWALAHINPSQVLYVFIVGIILNIVFFKTSNLLFTIVIHIGINIGGKISGFKQILESGVNLFNNENSELIIVLSSGILAIICILIILYINQRYQVEES